MQMMSVIEMKVQKRQSECKLEAIEYSVPFYRQD